METNAYVNGLSDQRSEHEKELQSLRDENQRLVERNRELRKMLNENDNYATFTRLRAESTAWEQRAREMEGALRAILECTDLEMACELKILGEMDSIRDIARAALHPENANSRDVEIKEEK